MKKGVLIFIILCISTISTIQSQSICGELHYKQVKNFGKIYTENYLIKFNTKLSYSEEINIKLSNNSDDIDDQENEYGTTSRTNTTTIGRNNLTPKFFYNNKVEFYFMDNFINEELIVKENKRQWNWELHQETKKIGDFTCQKATIHFRGRDYIAWFTNEIPVPFGPWKFQGLSGLILEVYDTDKTFHITSSKIKINTENCALSIDKDLFKKALSIQEYITWKEELLNAEFKKVASKMPKGFKAAKFDKNCEDCPKELETFDEEN